MKVYKKNDEIVVIDYDTNPENPRDWDDVFTFLGWHRDYCSPDKNDIGSIEDVCKLVGVGSPKTFKNSKTHVVYTVSMYEHSGIAFRLSEDWEDAFRDRWDSGIFGVMIAEKKKLRNFFKTMRLNMDKVFTYAKTQLDAYELYANGYVYQYAVYNMTENEIEWIDGCAGYYDIDTILDELKLTDDDYIGEFENILQVERHFQE